MFCFFPATNLCQGQGVIHHGLQDIYKRHPQNQSSKELWLHVAGGSCVGLERKTILVVIYRDPPERRRLLTQQKTSCACPLSKEEGWVGEFLRNQVVGDVVEILERVLLLQELACFMPFGPLFAAPTDKFKH